MPTTTSYVNFVHGRPMNRARARARVVVKASKRRMNFTMLVVIHISVLKKAEVIGVYDRQRSRQIS
jgi:hypothetical protein